MKEEKKNLIQIRGSGGAKGSAPESYHADDNLFSRQFASYLDLLSEGPIKGLVYGDSSIYFNEIRMRDVDLQTGDIATKLNHENFNFVTKDGESTQTVDPNFFDMYPTSSIVESKNSAKLVYNVPQFFTLSSSTFEKVNADYIKVTVITNGHQVIYLENNPTGAVHSYIAGQAGDTNGITTLFTIEFRYILANGTIKTVNPFNGNVGFIGKSSGKYAQTYGFNIEEIKNTDGLVDWAVKVTRMSQHETSSKVQRNDDIHVESIEASIADKLEYPYTAYVAGSFDAEKFSSIPKRTYEIDGRIIQVPKNYSPLDYNGRKIGVDDASGFTYGESITCTEDAISSINIEGNINDGYTALLTFNVAHGLTVGKNITLTVAGVAQGSLGSGNEAYLNITNRTAEVTSSVALKYTLEAEDNAVTTGTGAAVGSAVATFASGVIIDEIDTTNDYLWLRDLGGLNSITLNSTITGGTSSTTAIVTTQELAFIPPNYRRNVTTGIIGQYDQDWDGTFYNSWTNNPAWVFYDMLTNKIYGLGNYITTSEINKWELFSIAKYCDELVPAGLDAADYLSIYTTNDVKYTGVATAEEYEPRFTSNIVLRTKQEAYSVINSMASIFRGMIYWLNGEVFAVQDSEKDPIYQFTNANVINGEFTYEGNANKNRVNQVIVKWNNPQDMYRLREEYVESEEVLQTDKDFIKPKSIVAFGCTSRGQARRLGKWKLLTEKLNTNTIAFKTALNATFLQPGDIIRVVDKRKQGVSWGGRISSGTDTNTLVLDREFAVESDYTETDYEVMVSYSSGKALLAQDSATIDISGTNTPLSRGAIITTWRDTDNIIGTTTAVGSTSGSSTTVTLTAANTNIKVGMYVRGSGITAGDTVAGIDGTTLTLSNARTVSSATLTFSIILVDTNGDIAVADIERAGSIFDTDGTQVLIQWTPSHHTEVKTLASLSTASGKTTVNVTGNYSATPTTDEMWLIQRNTLSTGKTELMAQTYRVLSITESGKQEFEVAALEYNKTKFDAVDKNEAIESYRTYNLPLATDTIPKPLNINFETSIKTLDLGVLANVINFYWEPPKNPNGSQYTFIKSYHFEYSIDNINWISAGTVSGTSFQLENATQSSHYIRVYTINLLGQRSEPGLLTTGTLYFQQPTPSDVDGIGNQPFTINTTGTLPDSNLLLNTTTGLVSFSPTTFKYRAFGITTSVSSQANLDFSGLSNGETGYIYFDKSASSFIAREWDATSDTFYAVNGSSHATATGTLGAFTGYETGSRIITGNSTDFDGELARYNKLKVTLSSVDYYLRVLGFSTTSPNTILTLNEPFSIAIPNLTAFSKPTFLADYTNDSIFASVLRTGSAWSIELHGPMKGIDSYSINGSNENHSFTAAAGGTVDDFGTFTNDYTVTRGASTYSYAASGEVASTFGLSKSDSNCTTSISGAGQITCSALTQVAGKTTVTITDRAEGTTIATRIISFSKSLTGAGGSGSNAKTVKLTPNYHVINYTGQGTESRDITFTTAVQNTSGTVYYEFLVDGSAPTGGAVNGTTTTFALPNADDPAIGTSTAITVKIRETSTSAAIIATDTVTIYAVQDGSDAVIAFLTNQAHVVSAATDGTLASGALDNAGGTYKVFVGGTNKTTGNSVVYSKVSNTGCTAAINSSTGVYTISAVASNEATAVFQAVVPAAATGSIAVTHTADYSISKSKVGTTGDTTYTWIKYGTDINGANLTDTYVAGTTTYIGHAYNKTTATESTNAGDYTWSKLEGDDGAVGKRTANGYLYYNTLQASAPDAPSNSSVQYAFATGLLSGGVIGTGGTNWNQAAPASTGGSAASKIWYVYWATIEATAGGGTGTTVTLGSTVYNAHNFVGLVRFTGTNTIVDGSGETISLGSGGTTTIDGDAITTGTVDAGRIDTDLLRITGTNFTGEHQGGEVGGWTLASDAIYSGTKDTTGYTGSNGHITICSSGSIHTPAFFVETDGTAGFKGTVTIGGNDLTTTNTLNANTTAGNVGLGNVDNDSTSTIRAVGAATSGTTGGWTIDSSSIYSGTKDTSGFTPTAGHITISSAGGIHTPKFYVDSSGNAGFSGTVTIGGTDLTSTNTLNTNTTAGDVSLGNVTNVSQSTIQSATLSAADADDVGLGNVDNTTDASVLSTASTASNSQAKTGGSVGGLTLAADKMYIGTGTINNANTAFYVDNTGKMSLKDKLYWDGTTLNISGNITVGNASAVRSTLNVADGSTANSTDAQIRAVAAATSGTAGGWTISSTKIYSTNIELNSTNRYLLISDD